MNLWQYRTTMILGVACVGLSIAIVTMAKSNEDVQEEIQAHQQQLNNSVLGQQAQQITSTILQDMAAVAAKNESMRTLLAKYGYNIKPAQQTPSKKAVEPIQEEK